jgi:hypothetical protein
MIRDFFFAMISLAGYIRDGLRRVCGTDAALTKAPVRRRHWLPLSLPVHARDANQTRSLLFGARSLNESKFRPWTTTAQSGFSSRIEPTSGSILNRSFASGPITQTGKLTTTNASNAGHLCAANNSRPAERRVLLEKLRLGHVSFTKTAIN